MPSMSGTATRRAAKRIQSRNVHVVYPGQLNFEYYYYYSTRDHRVMIPSTQVTPVQRHGSSCRPFSGPALSTVSINIAGYSQAKAEIVSTFAHAVMATTSSVCKRHT